MKVVVAFFLVGCSTCPGVASSSDIAGTGAITSTSGVHHAIGVDWTSSTPTTRDDHSFDIAFEDGFYLRCTTNAWLAGKEPIEISQLGCVVDTADASLPLEHGTATPVSHLDGSGNGDYQLRFDVPETQLGDWSLAMDGLVAHVVFDSEACGGASSGWPYI